MRFMTWILISSALVACSDASSPPPASSGGEGGTGGGGSGGNVSSGTVSSGTGMGGEAGEGGAGGSLDGRVILSIATPADCGGFQRREQGAVVPAPAEIGAIALGRFEAQTPLSVEEFRYVACSGAAHEVVLFASSSTVPDESPGDVRVIEVSGASGDEEQRPITVPIDPPLQLTEEKPFGYLGVRMTEEGSSTMCVATCRDSTQPERNYWSDHAEAPFGWKQLSQSPTPNSGLQDDYIFSVVGRPF